MYHCHQHILSIQFKTIIPHCVKIKFSLKPMCLHSLISLSFLLVFSFTQIKVLLITTLEKGIFMPCQVI